MDAIFHGFSGTSTTSRRKIEAERRQKKADRERRRSAQEPKLAAQQEQDQEQEQDQARDIAGLSPQNLKRPSGERRDKDKDRDRDKKTSRHRRRKHSDSVSASASALPPKRDHEPDTLTSTPLSSPGLSKDAAIARNMDLVPEMERRPTRSASSSSYPTFSKKYSRENPSSRESLPLRPYTPDATDIGRGSRTPDRKFTQTRANAAPPSPPLTTRESDLRRARSGEGVRKTPSHIRIVSPPRKSSVDKERHVKKNARRTDSASVLRNSAESEGRASPKPGTITPKQRSAEDLSVAETATSYDERRLRGAQSTAKSDVTASTATESTVEPSPTKAAASSRRTPSQPIPVAILDTHSSSTSASDSSPRTPIQQDARFPPTSYAKQPDGDAMPPSPYSTQSSYAQTPRSAAMGMMPPPPPPPPPMNGDIEMPRVDYLLQNGGLPHLVPKRFTSVLAPSAPQASQYPNFISPRAFGPQHTDVRSIFAPLQGILNSYLQVMQKNGSIAVATGYRSVARRLLDRLEAVFNRNISSESCDCIMCAQDDSMSMISEDEGTGISWGEILEFVAGRKELPVWPPFSLEDCSPQLAMNAEAPMQKMDVDVPPEYREHYIKQSRRTKDAVQSWLAMQPEVRSSPPQDVDDETLMFAMVTHLPTEERKMFTALLKGMTTLPTSRAPTPGQGGKSEIVKRTALALQRLYRLQDPPRDAECAIFLLRNPNLHSVLATLSAISAGEWDILISGRFDGFLWSGADGQDHRPQSRGPTPFRSMTPGIPSRGPTPSQAATSRGPSRGPTATPVFGPGVAGAPVQMDEDTEVAVLAEVEREIYMGMDALEDAFEALHAKAEEVRAALRARNAGLSVSAQRRRGGSLSGGPEAMMESPGIGTAMWGAPTLDEEWMDDARSEIKPDDSASNISYNRRRRHKREKERRQTPAAVEEEAEE